MVQVVGTYIMGNTLSILLYPATDQDLETLMDSIFEEDRVIEDRTMLQCITWPFSMFSLRASTYSRKDN